MYEEPLILDHVIPKGNKMLSLCESHVDSLQKPESIFSFLIQADQKREIPECDYQQMVKDLYKEIGETIVPIYSV